MKTPCLKCGLIHDEPTAICDGYAGLDPDETASDSKKQAAARIRAILAAVPIETRPGSRGRRRAETSSSVAEMKPPSERKLENSEGPVAGAATEAATPEVPEWRREVSERLETYRQRREKQSRGGTNGQSVLEFRVHSRKEAGAAEAEASPAADEAPGLIMDSRLEASLARMEAAAGVAAQESSTAGAAASIPEEAAIPQAMAAAAGAGASRAAASSRGSISLPATERVYIQPEIHAAEQEPAAMEEAARDFEELSYPTADIEAETFMPEDAIADRAEEAPASGPLAAAVAETAAEPVEALLVSQEPAVVLADARALEVHADAMEAEEVVSGTEEMASGAAPETAAAMAKASPAADALAAISSIDTEYWRTAPGIEPAQDLEFEEEECGSLTSARDLAAAKEAIAPHAAAAEESAEAGLPAHATAQELPQPPAEEAFVSPIEAEAEAPAYAAISGVTGAAETLFQEPGGETETEESDPRRQALRTASRRTMAPTERIEISVPQPVFDFTEEGAQAEHPQDQHVPVADLRERRTAGAIDAALLAVTVAAFFIAFHLAGGELAFSRVGAAVVLAASFLIYAQYFLLFTVTAGATPGMMLRGLRVVCFDGNSAGPLELGWRAFGCLLSAAAGMLGFIWAAWDEDGLTWHDRISQTYITYAEIEARQVHAAVQ